MMEEDKLINSIRLRGTAFRAAEKYTELLETSRNEYQLKHEEAAVELRRIQSKHITILREAWCDMVRQVFTKPDADITWQNSNYRLDITYIDEHKIAFLNIYDSKETPKIKHERVVFSGSNDGGLLH